MFKFQYKITYLVKHYKDRWRLGCVSHPLEDLNMLPRVLCQFSFAFMSGACFAKLLLRIMLRAGGKSCHTLKNVDPPPPQFLVHHGAKHWLQGWTLTKLTSHRRHRAVIVDLRIMTPLNWQTRSWQTSATILLTDLQINNYRPPTDYAPITAPLQ